MENKFNNISIKKNDNDNIHTLNINDSECNKAKFNIHDIEKLNLDDIKNNNKEKFINTLNFSFNLSEYNSICENEDNVSEHNSFIDNQIKSNLLDNNYIITNNDVNRNTLLNLNNLN